MIREKIFANECEMMGETILVVDFDSPKDGFFWRANNLIERKSQGRLVAWLRIRARPRPPLAQGCLHGFAQRPENFIRSTSIDPLIVRRSRRWSNETRICKNVDGNLTMCIRRPIWPDETRIPREEGEKKKRKDGAATRKRVIRKVDRLRSITSVDEGEQLL